MQSRPCRCCKVNIPVVARKLLTMPAFIKPRATFFSEPDDASSGEMSSMRTRSEAVISTGKVQHPDQQPLHIPFRYGFQTERRSMMVCGSM